MPGGDGMRRALLLGVGVVLVAGCDSGSFGSDDLEDSAIECSDGWDNDADGLTDCEDPGCAGVGGCPAKGGDSGTTPPDQFTPFDLGGGSDTGPCVASEAEAKNKFKPVDIIWFIDTSGSMDFETKTVQNNMNAFAKMIAGTVLDYRVVLIADPGDICIPAPLGGPGCTDGAKFKHVKVSVGSDDGLEKLISTYPKYQSFLRTDSIRHFVAVTDDESDKSASWFKSQVAALKSPGFPNGFVFHSIVAYGNIFWIGCITGAKIGNYYLKLTADTGGTKAKVCETNWQPIFSALAKSVVANTKVPCAYTIPSPGAGKTVDPQKVNVSHTPVGGKANKIPKVKNAAACPATTGAWYYDNETNPKTVHLCPGFCKLVGQGKIKVLFGCKTIIK